jgi:Helix-turn-helix domain
VFALSKTCVLRLPPILRRERVANIQLICSWYFCSWNSTNSEVPDQAKFFARLGERIRKLRKTQGFSQEDMISFGFSARHWQQIEAGRPITVTTLLRICEVFSVPVARLLQGLDKGIY